MTTDWLAVLGFVLLVVGVWYAYRGPTIYGRRGMVLTAAAVVVIVAAAAYVAAVSVAPIT